MPSPSPDRFVPLHVLAPDRYRASKPPHELSSSERLLRTDRAGTDAFCFTRERSVPISPRRLSRSECIDRGHATVLELGQVDRLPSHGAVWSVGGTAPSGGAIDGGRGRLVSSGSNARLFTSSFPNLRPKSEEDQEKHEDRLALALDMDRVQRVLDFSCHRTFPRCKRAMRRPTLESAKTMWTGTEWTNDCPYAPKDCKEERILPNAPFKVLDAPGLRDDFYCSIMAYSSTCSTLAVGLGNLLYGWSESGGVSLLHDGRDGPKNDAWLTSVAFSSERGDRSILAFGRSSGTLTLMSLSEGLMPRFNIMHEPAVACLSWRPVLGRRPSSNPQNPGVMVDMEDLLEVARHNWRGEMTKLVRIKVHTQQVCGLAWSATGSHFATGGNDNLCCLFQVNKIFRDERNESKVVGAIPTIAAPDFSPSPPVSPCTTIPSSPSSMSDVYDWPYLRQTIPRNTDRFLPLGSEKHQWRHTAAVKAIAFCPWREGLIATGGGSNDKCIHFYHTTSGATLATISVAAQVTSLIWSKTRREIAATFRYAQPDHPYRIAVFGWPDCRQVAAIPWEGEHRALYAIAYPGGPSDTYRTRERRKSRTAAEGCIVVASSDESVKFHEIWLAGRKATALGSGVLAGSDILEMEEGIDKEGDVIR
ncbi:WD40 repeat-like protein [Xylariaceae sp. FL1019]|nr:WD40 repeat-like protein [Xylariaceae sp. FL1019]